MDKLVSLLLRLLLLAAGLVIGLVLFTSMAAAVAVLWLAWSLRMGWARLTGRPVSPFIMGIDPRQAFEIYRRARAQQQRGRAGEESRTPRADATRAHTPGTARILQVTDVEPREPGR